MDPNAQAGAVLGFLLGGLTFPSPPSSWTTATHKLPMTCAITRSIDPGNPDEG